MTMREREGIIDVDPSFRSKWRLNSPWSHQGIGVPDEWGGFPTIDTKSIAESIDKLPRQPAESEQIYDLDAQRAYHPRSNRQKILSHKTPLGPYPLDSIGPH